MNVEPRAAVAIIPVSKTNGATATGEPIDCKGYDRLHIVVEASASDNTTNKESVLKLQEAATTDATNFADISGFVGGTDFTIPDAQTTVTKPRALFSVDLTKNRKRYIRVLASPVEIGANVWLGERVCVLRGVTIGEGSIVGAGSVVTKDIPPRSIAVGAPARVIRRWDEAAHRWVPVD